MRTSRSARSKARRPEVPYATRQRESARRASSTARAAQLAVSSSEQRASAHVLCPRTSTAQCA